MVPVARACAAAGDEVVVAAPASFAPAVEAAGLPHLPFPDVAPERMAEVFGRVARLPRDEGERVVMSEVFGRLDAQAALPALVEAVERFAPDVVVRDPCEFGSLVAAVAAGVPHAQVGISLDAFVGLVAGRVDEALRELETLAGLPGPQGAALVLGSPTVTTVPALLDSALGAPVVDQDAPATWRFRAPVTDGGPSLPDPAWGRQDAPLVYVSFGSVAGALPHLAGLYPAVVEALAEEPVRVLLTTGNHVDTASLGTLPDNTSAVPWWPQEAVMREASLVVGHGGFGTTTAALAAGVPQVVVPLFAGDQFLNARAVAALGAGAELLGGAEAVTGLPAVVAEVLGDARHREAAAEVASAMAALPDVSSAVEFLHGLARTAAR